MTTTDFVCRNQEVNYYLNGDFDTVRWNVTGGLIYGSNTFGPTVSRQGTVVWSNTPGNGSITVTAYKGGCSQSTTRPSVIADATAPPPASIWLFGDRLMVCSDSTSTRYEWFYNGQSVGAGKQYFVANTSQPGIYTVKTCQGECCNLSAGFTYPPAVQKETGPDAALRIHPNPSAGEIRVTGGSQPFGSGTLRLLDRIGIPVAMVQIDQPEYRWDLSWLPPGLYFLRYTDRSSAVSVAKLIKL